MTAFLEQDLRMGFLKISGADLGRRDLRRNGKHRHARAMAVEQSVDEMQVSGPATARAHRELTGQMRLGARREGCHLLVPDMHPLDPTLAAQRVGQSVQAVADDAIDPLYARCGKGFGELICYGLHDLSPLLELFRFERCFPLRLNAPWGGSFMPGARPGLISAGLRGATGLGVGRVTVAPLSSPIRGTQPGDGSGP